MQSVLEGMCNKVEYGSKYPQKMAGQLEECSDSKRMQIVLNGRTCKYNFGGIRFHMILQSCEFSHGLCLNNFLPIWFIGNQIDHAPLFRYINLYNEVYCLVRGRKVLGYMKYFMSSVKRVVEAVGIWTEDNLDMKRVNSLYTMVSVRSNFKINKRFDSLSWSSVVRDFYTRRGYVMGELNEEQEQS